MTPKSDQLEDDERALEVKSRACPPAAVVYETICAEGEDELQRSFSALAWSGLGTGLSMGFSVVAEALLETHLPEAAWRPLISKFGHCIGFLIVIIHQREPEVRGDWYINALGCKPG